MSDTPVIVKFQFLNGTIGVPAAPVAATPATPFQFLNGTIGVRYKNGLIMANKAVF